MRADDPNPPPVLAPSRHTQPFWDACQREILQASCCQDCGHAFLPAGPVCPRCWSGALGTLALYGFGRVFSFTIYRQAYHPGLTIPLVVALIELNEGPRLISNVIGCAPETVRIGMAVQVCFERQGDYTLPRFAPVDAPTGREA